MGEQYAVPGGARRDATGRSTARDVTADDDGDDDGAEPAIPDSQTEINSEAAMKPINSKWINKFPNNPTQTRYRRGIKTVYSDIDSDFGKRARTFQKKWNNPYERPFGEGEE